MIYISIFLAAAYAMFILFCFVSWIKLKEKPILHNSGNKISVVIAIRNEEENISTLIKSLDSQSLSSNLFEVIIVNDHSEDATLEKINVAGLSFQLKTIELDETESGKKHAIHKGVLHAQYNIIVTTDADCIHSVKWLDTIHQRFNASTNKMLVMPVKLAGKTFLENCQALEFMGLQAITASLVSANYPIMCNGANLAFLKQDYLEVFDGVGGKNLSSGDDTFLLFALKEKYGSKAVSYLKNNNVLITTQPISNLKTFIEQRVRWAKKTPVYKKPVITLLGIFLLVVNIFLPFSLLVCLITGGSIFPFYIVLFAKCVFDFIYLFSFSTFTKQEGLLQYFFYVLILNPVYLSVVFILSVLGKHIKWKNREV
ncbi:MAG: glycosyltransferase [Bacteroidetes bacterium]|nr:glycosyltransferase [Bacteroidota bacterium]